jgi:hypothetical protein
VGAILRRVSGCTRAAITRKWVKCKSINSRPNFAHLATLMPDGSPQSVPIWVGREGDRILICTGEAPLRRRTLGVIRVCHSPWLTFRIPTRKHSFVVGLWSADLMAIAST